MRLTTACIFLLLPLTGCYQQADQQTTESTEQTLPEQVSPPKIAAPVEDAASNKEAFVADAFQQVQAGTATLVDVRSDEEWNESHFKVAKHIPIDKIKDDPEAAFESIDKKQTVFLH